MTMQIAIRADDGFVVASDTSARTTDTNDASIIPASYPVFESKTLVNRKHQVCMALAGYTPPDDDPAKVLDDSLNQIATLPDDFAGWLETWAQKYSEDRAVRCSLLIVSPKAEVNRIINLSVQQSNCKAIADLRCRLAPDPTNPANFWLQYFKCQDRPSIAVATKALAFTIFMAAQLNPFGIGGLEVFQYRKEWNRLTTAEIEGLEDECKEVKRAIDKITGA